MIGPAFHLQAVFVIGLWMRHESCRHTIKVCLVVHFNFHELLESLEVSHDSRLGMRGSW